MNQLIIFCYIWVIIIWALINESDFVINQWKFFHSIMGVQGYGLGDEEGDSRGSKKIILFFLISELD